MILENDWKLMFEGGVQCMSLSWHVFDLLHLPGNTQPVPGTSSGPPTSPRLCQTGVAEGFRLAGVPPIHGQLDGFWGKCGSNLGVLS